MRTVELELSRIKSFADAKDFGKKEQLKKGDTLKVFSEEGRTAIYTVATVIILAVVYAFTRRNEKKKREEEGERLLNELVFKGKSFEEIEKRIEKDYGIKVRVEKNRL